MLHQKDLWTHTRAAWDERRRRTKSDDTLYPEYVQKCEVKQRRERSCGRSSACETSEGWKKREGSESCVIREVGRTDGLGILAQKGRSSQRREHAWDTRGDRAKQTYEMVARIFLTVNKYYL